MRVKELLEKLRTEFEDNKELHRYYSREYEERFLDLLSDRTIGYEVVCNDEDLEDLGTQQRKAYAKMNDLRIAIAVIEERAT